MSFGKPVSIFRDMPSISRCRPSSAPPAERNTRPPTSRPQRARSARTNASTSRRPGRPGPRSMRWRRATTTASTTTSRTCSASAPCRISASASARCSSARPAATFCGTASRYLDRATIEIVKALGGISAIAISHPHFYTTMVEWSRAFDAPVHLHAADRQWIMRPDPAIKLWDGDTLIAGRRPHADPLRRSFRRRHRAALGGGRGRPRRAPLRRHRAVRPGDATT